jgi:hypothetical protein
MGTWRATHTPRSAGSDVTRVEVEASGGPSYCDARGAARIIVGAPGTLGCIRTRGGRVCHASSVAAKSRAAVAAHDPSRRVQWAPSGRRCRACSTGAGTTGGRAASRSTATWLYRNSAATCNLDQRGAAGKFTGPQVGGGLTRASSAHGPASDKQPGMQLGTGTSYRGKMGPCNGPCCLQLSILPPFTRPSCLCSMQERSKPANALSIG